MEPSPCLEGWLEVVPVIGIGAGGHARVVIEILQSVGCYKVVGLLDAKWDLWHTEVLGVPVLGDDELLPELLSQGVELVFIGLGGIGDTRPRRRLYERALAVGFRVVQAIHPRAVVSPSALMGDGVTVMAGAVINAQAQVGVNVIVNTGAIVDHECLIGDHVHLATGSQLCSAVNVGDGAHIGAGATVKQCISIGEGAVVGAGAVVVKDVDPLTVVAGVPARVLTRGGAETSHHSAARSLRTALVPDPERPYRDHTRNSSPGRQGAQSR